MTQGPSHVILSSKRTNWHCPDRPPPRLAVAGFRAAAGQGAHTPTHTLSLISQLFCAACMKVMWTERETGAAISVSLRRSSRSADVNLIITLLLEVDVVLLPEPGVGQVARVRLRLAGEECILGNVDGDVFRRRDDVGRPWEKQTVVIETRQDLHPLHIKLSSYKDLTDGFKSTERFGASLLLLTFSVLVRPNLVSRLTAPSLFRCSGCFEII